MTWLLAPHLVSLVLSVAGPNTVVGEAHGLAATPCPAYGSVVGTRVGVTALCEVPALLGGGTHVQPHQFILEIDPATLGGRWVGGGLGHGDLIPQ